MGSLSIAGVTGEMIVKDAPDYHGLTGAIAQYATVILRHVKANGQAVAIQTGGHQYSGASSTNSSKILIDLKMTFRGVGDRTVTLLAPDGTGKGWSRENGLFLPQGLCGKVYIRGCVQTGGCGMLIRAFGLFGDHFTELEIVKQLGNIEKPNKTTDAGLFEALLGGNRSVITHFTLKAHRDADYVGSKDIKSLHPYTVERL